MNEEAVKQNISIGEYVLEDQAKQMETSKEKILENMDKQLSVMEQSAEKGSSADIRSTSGLTGGDAFRMLSYIDEKTSISGAFCSKAMATAIAVAECNAAMGRIVASPTAGSCGILPGALLPMMKEKKAKRLAKKNLVKALASLLEIGRVLNFSSNFSHSVVEKANKHPSKPLVIMNFSPISSLSFAGIISLPLTSRECSYSPINNVYILLPFPTTLWHFSPLQLNFNI